jgi:Rieske Fe-S protein
MSSLPYNSINPNFSYREHFESKTPEVVYEKASGEYIVDGTTRINSICPHQQCKLNYNSNSQEFVCPCHASRFNINGNCLKGPACPSNIKIQSNN